MGSVAVLHSLASSLPDRNCYLRWLHRFDLRYALSIAPLFGMPNWHAAKLLALASVLFVATALQSLFSLDS